MGAAKGSLSRRKVGTLQEDNKPNTKWLFAVMFGLDSTIPPFLCISAFC